MGSKKGMLLINTRFNVKDGLIGFTPNSYHSLFGPSGMDMPVVGNTIFRKAPKTF